MIGRIYEIYIAPEDPFISQQEFDALDYKGKGEAVLHLLKYSDEAGEYAEQLYSKYSDDEVTAILICANNYAKRFFRPANPRLGEMPEGVRDVTPARPRMVAVIPVPGVQPKPHV